MTLKLEIMRTKETLKKEIINLLSVPNYKQVRQISYDNLNHSQMELQMEFDYKMQNLMNEWDKL